jgi:hypothetical protein
MRVARPVQGTAAEPPEQTASRRTGRRLPPRPVPLVPPPVAQPARTAARLLQSSPLAGLLPATRPASWSLTNRFGRRPAARPGTSPVSGSATPCLAGWSVGEASPPHRLPRPRSRRAPTRGCRAATASLRTLASCRSCSRCRRAPPLPPAWRPRSPVAAWQSCAAQRTPAFIGVSFARHRRRKCRASRAGPACGGNAVACGRKCRARTAYPASVAERCV